MGKRGPKPGSLHTCGVCGQRGHNSKRHTGWSDKRTGQKANNLHAFYRLSYADYLAMLEKGCGLCGRDLHDRTPDVDHDHGCDHPGKGSASCRACIRGTLDRSCNLRVGAFERGLNHDPDVAAYLAAVSPLALPYERQGVLF